MKGPGLVIGIAATLLPPILMLAGRLSGCPLPEHIGMGIFALLILFLIVVAVASRLGGSKD